MLIAGIAEAIASETPFRIIAILIERTQPTRKKASQLFSFKKAFTSKTSIPGVGIAVWYAGNRFPFDPGDYTVGTNPVIINGFIPAVTYNACIRALCGVNSDLPGEWGEDTVTFTTDICPDVEGLVISNLTAHSADASWNPTTGVSGYSVLWFMEDAEQGTATVQNPTYHLDSLEADMPYRVLVKNICAEGAMSEHWASAEFNTPEDNPEGIDDVAGTHLSLYPNPATSTVTISFDGFGRSAMVEIVDMNGRTVRKQESHAASVSLNLEGLAQGAYFVRVTGDNATAVRRLIVK